MNKQIFPFLLLIFTIACNNQPNKQNTTKDSTSEALPFIQLKKLIHQYPDSARLYDALIDQYATLKNYKMATAWADSAILQDSVKNFQYWFVKGDLFRQNLQYDSAVYNYEVYLKNFPDDEDILMNLANTFAEAGNVKCIPLTDRLMKGFPTNETKSRSFFIRGIFYARTKQWPLADENFDKAIQIDYQFSEAYIEKGIALFDQQKTAAAQAVFNQLKEINNTYPDAYYWIAKCQEASNHKDSALLNYQKAYGLDKTYTDAKDAVERLKK
jgi:tetratricopeptide (TPR) repeat protein